MKKPPIPVNEAERLASLKSYRVLDTLPEQAFDDITTLASQLCNTPIALVSLIDENRQWFKSHHGLNVKETPRDLACCAHAINEPHKILEVPDAQEDERFFDNPLVADFPNVRFYAGAPLVNSEGYALGTLCVIDHQPRQLDPGQLKALAALSRQVVAQLEYKKKERILQLTQFSFENSPEGLAWVDEDANVIKFNDRYAEIVGFSREILSQKKIYEFDPNFTRELWKVHWQEMLEKKTMIMESDSKGADGTLTPLELRLKILEFEGQKYIHALCMDITERKKTERRIKSSEANLTALIENSGDTIWSINRQYCFITFNSVFRNAMKTFTGQEPKAGEKLNFNVFPNETGKYLRTLHQRAFNGERFIEEIRIEEGERSKTVETSFNPIVDEAGVVIGASVFSRDITSKVEERMKKNRFQDGLKRLNDLASSNQMSFGELMTKSLKVIGEFLNMPLGMVSKIRDGRYKVIAYHTTDDQFRFRVGEVFDLEGTYCDITYKQEEVIAVDEMGASPYSGLSCYQGKRLESYIGAIIYVNNKKYGTVNFCDKAVRKVLFDTYDKEFLQLLANWIGAEIARRRINEQLRKARDKAEAASVAKDNFLSTISHEIRTPLNAVIGMTHILLQEDPAPHQTENLNLIKFSGENLLVLINDILDYNKIEANKLIIDDQIFNLEELLISIKGAMDFKAREKGIRFILEYDDRIPAVLIGDSVRIAQVINNLAGNAVKFTEEGWVKLSVKAVKETEKDTILHISVEDTGIGIRKEKLKTIFDRFVQAESSTTRKYGGTGLGLSITRKLLKMMGSQVRVKSEEGKGTCFYFDLKLMKAEEISKVPGKRECNRLEDLTPFGLKVLVAEDNEANRLVIHKFLDSWGVWTEFAEDGRKAVEKVASGRYDLLLMDLQMPDMDGYTATRHIRAMEGEYYRKIPILALTASVMNNVKERAMQAGMNDYVTKPFVPIDLYNKITDCLGIEPCLHNRNKSKAEEKGKGQGTDTFMHRFEKLAQNDPVFRGQLVNSYRDNLMELKENYPQALKQGDASQVSRISHKVRFTLTTLGADELLELLEKGKGFLSVLPEPETLETFTRHFISCCDQLSRQLEALSESRDSIS